ncbi:MULTISPECIES: type II toxin-antitoxin system RelB/DinJ family antitoxin [Enterobacteriaceae]|uniref:type II toxin-antitoxin system RelB/DinJ family antitoxin n=1 Tax=Enterobacteriaceae TaxID=543 RepID=UPI000755CF45|nr:MULTISPECIES: type II toxin-antitoxin system RelB/DinJ family antitoxin [Enterobacteriaceae]KVJ80199.1 RelB antitoxin [Enterobacter hormaechei subsp. xiangfangensis]MDT7444938.1 type II toxin-antitoxin system RelB/DinJ family antitoxin [Citrobacter freundii]WLZ38160.1 type II toxin-antitoxin system RelB/DinJ family antitoxin [Enterobacter hormaechei]WLZ42822.1 type II toxin-antitoxin system RelB/DinJ family antitoxin [Enterobacter hormaechei]WLZ61779.1 type II toxin-antitoxin system RelB/Di
MTGFFERKKRAKNAQLTVRLDEQLKKRAELRLEAMGMTATEAVEQLYRFIADHGRMPVTERIVTFDIQSQRGRAIALNPADAVTENTRRFLQSLGAVEVVCCDPAAFEQAVLEYFSLYVADQAACLLAGVLNVTFMVNAASRVKDDWHDRLLSLLQRDFDFSEEQSVTFINSIVDSEHVDPAIVSRNNTAWRSGKSTGSGAAVLQRFLTFLAERGVSCSDPQRLTVSAGRAWGVRENMIGNMPPDMQQAINDGVIFEASADTPDFSPELAAAFGFTQAQAEAVLKPALAARDLPGFLQRFLAFLADRGISCSNPRRFTEKVTEHASHEGLHRLIAMLMSRIRDEGVCFVFHNESPDELPRLAASLPGELADTFGFTGWQATTILRQIQPARPGQD